MRYLRALGLGALSLSPDQFYGLTFGELMELIQARSDWIQISQGHDPYVTRADRRSEIERLKKVAKDYGKK